MHATQRARPWVVHSSANMPASSTAPCSQSRHISSLPDSAPLAAEPFRFTGPDDRLPVIPFREYSFLANERTPKALKVRSGKGGWSQNQTSKCLGSHTAAGMPPGLQRTQAALCVQGFAGVCEANVHPTMSAAPAQDGRITIIPDAAATAAQLSDGKDGKVSCATAPSWLFSEHRALACQTDALLEAWKDAQLLLLHPIATPPASCLSGGAHPSAPDGCAAEGAARALQGCPAAAPEHHGGRVWPV